MNILTQNSAPIQKSFVSGKSPAAEKAANDTPAAPQETFTRSEDRSNFLEGAAIFAGVALAGAAGGAVASFAPGYWSVPANLASTAGINAGAIAASNAIGSNKDSSGYGALQVIAGGTWGIVSGTASGVATNLLESLTGMPRVAAGAICGAATNVALYATL